MWLTSLKFSDLAFAENVCHPLKFRGLHSGPPLTIPLPARGKKSPAIWRAILSRACVHPFNSIPGIPSLNSLSPPLGLTQASEEAKGSCLQGDGTEPGHASWAVHRCVWGGWITGAGMGKEGTSQDTVLVLWAWASQVYLPCCSDGEESACNAGDLGSIPGSGRSPGKGNGNPLQYSCLGNPTQRGAWGATVRGVTKSRARPSD